MTKKEFRDRFVCPFCIGDSDGDRYSLVTAHVRWQLGTSSTELRQIDESHRMILRLRKICGRAIKTQLRGQRHYDPTTHVLAVLRQDNSFRTFMQLREGARVAMAHRWSLGTDVRALFNEVQRGLDEDFDQRLQAPQDLVWLLTNPYSSNRARVLITEGIALSVLKSFV